MRKSPLTFSLLALVAAAGQPAAAVAAAASRPAAPAGPKLSVDAYLDQVRTGNTAYRSAAKSAEGAAARKNEGSLITSPQLFASAQAVADRSYHPIQGNPFVQNTYSFGFQQQTRFGLSGKLYYNSVYSSANNLDPQLASFGSALGTGQFYDNKPVLEVSFSLWRNFLGGETAAQVEALDAGNAATAFQGQLAVKQVTAGAEAAYWRLALARDAVRVQQETYDRSGKMREWAASRARSGLGERSDLLQSEAVLRLRRLEFQAAIDELRSAGRAFNLGRGVNGDEVAETLETIPTLVDTFAARLPERDGVREDVLAAQAQARAAQANSRLSTERNRPNVEAFGTLALNGHDADLSPAVTTSLTTQLPTTAVGVRVNIPLNVPLTADVRHGYEATTQAADLQAQRRGLETESEWADLVQRYAEARQRLELAREIERVQREKFDLERDRHRRGKTTTFVVLQFEQDLYTAELTRLRVAGELLGVVSQLKTFTGSKS